MSKKERTIQNQIEKYLQSKGHYAVSVQSGSVLKKTGNRLYKITLAPQGTPDILACIYGLFVGIEVKRDEQERKKWVGVADRYLESAQELKSRKKEIEQFKTGCAIGQADGLFICTYSIEHLEECLEEFFSKIKAERNLSEKTFMVGKTSEY